MFAAEEGVVGCLLLQPKSIGFDSASWLHVRGSGRVWGATEGGISKLSSALAKSGRNAARGDSPDKCTTLMPNRLEIA